MKRWIVPLFAALLALGLSNVASAQGQSQGQGQGQSQSQGKGQGKGQGQGQGQGQSQSQDYYQDKGKDKSKDYDEPNHGQVVSECNHRANSRNLKGQERKDFTEWCESRGPQYKYDENRYGNERNCYQKANNKGLSGDKRANFLNKCLAETDSKYYGGKAPAKKKD